MRGSAAILGTAALIAATLAVSAAGAAPARSAKLSLSEQRRMCAHLGTGAHQMAKAIGAVRQHKAKLAASRLTEATSQFRQATKFLAAAQRRLLQLGGSKAFVA
jgi:Spy/CpxP family protein refolding chaperone